jgi:hypothetical protein
MEWIIGISAVLILDVLALRHLSQPRTERDRSNGAWHLF